jgi:hypothetical protein
MPKPNPALLPRPALFDVTVVESPIDRRIERIPLEEIELAANARREISEEGIERLAAMLCRTGQQRLLVRCGTLRWLAWAHLGSCIGREQH